MTVVRTKRGAPGGTCARRAECAGRESSYRPARAPQGPSQYSHSTYKAVVLQGVVEKLSALGVVSSTFDQVLIR